MVFLPIVAVTIFVAPRFTVPGTPYHEDPLFLTGSGVFVASPGAATDHDFEQVVT